MNVLFVGDVFGQSGMTVVRRYLRQVRDDYDFVVVNGENAAAGRGITRKLFGQLREAGADVVTLGNHSWDQAEALKLVEETPHLIRPLNYPPGTPGLGSGTFSVRNGERVTVAQVMGRVLMQPLDDPFRAIDRVLTEQPIGANVLVDFHAEATSEKKVMGYHLAGRCSALIGTHTHVQTADQTILSGTGYITDVGMTGPQNSSVGMNFDEVHYRLTSGLPKRFRPSSTPGEIRAVAIVLQEGKTRAIRRIQAGHKNNDIGQEVIEY